MSQNNYDHMKTYLHQQQPPSYFPQQQQHQNLQLSGNADPNNYVFDPHYSPQPEPFEYEQGETQPSSYQNRNQHRPPTTSSNYGGRPYSSHGNSYNRYQGPQEEESNTHRGRFSNSQEGTTVRSGPSGFHIAGTKMFVNNIEVHVSADDIQQYFGLFGKINDVKVFHKPDQNYAYVIYDRYEDAFAASKHVPPNPNWSLSLAKSKNTVMQYQQSSLWATHPLPHQGSFKPSNFQGNPQEFRRDYSRFDNHPQGYNNRLHDQGNRFHDQGARYHDQDNRFNSQNFRNYRSQHPNQFTEGGGKKFHAESHLDNIINNCKDANQLVDLMLMPTDRIESLANNKTQLNQTILVREIWISNINEKCKSFIKDVLQDNFGPIEDVEFFSRGEQSFAFIKFYMVQTAFLAFSNKERVAQLLETDRVKLTYSDPSRRRNIIGDHKEYMKDENLSPVLFVSFPFGFKVSKHVIFKIASDYGTVLNVTVKRSDDPKQTSSVLIEFKDLRDTKFAFENLREDQERMHPKCEFAILSNSEKFIKDNNLKLKDKTKDPQLTGTFQNRGKFDHAPNQNVTDSENDINAKRTYKQAISEPIEYYNNQSNNQANVSKKEEKSLQKDIQKSNKVNSESIYDPIDTMQDKKVSNMPAKEEEEEDYGDEEDLYDASLVQVQKEQNTNEDLSELIDNPDILQNMLKKIN